MSFSIDIFSGVLNVCCVLIELLSMSMYAATAYFYFLQEYNGRALSENIDGFVFCTDLIDFY